jgi:DNA-binding XRE family transcriptional regulator
MSGIHKFTTPKGEPMVIMPEAEYNRLIATAEDAADIAMADSVIARIRAGAEAFFPGDIAKRLMLEEENPIRVLRDYRGMTAEALAREAGISRVYLTQIETGRRSGRTDVMKRIAQALKVDMNLLV